MDLEVEDLDLGAEASEGAVDAFQVLLVEGDLLEVAQGAVVVLGAPTQQRFGDLHHLRVALLFLRAASWTLSLRSPVGFS